ncbi:type II toxin-antitoxin system VapC family toxin [Prosthecobacter sp.]|uniref:type II toxin-antitoxin system VapC family toxin n=1 Tax=Prosthecobacter sp. TaxID=1965333 RepID=UPI0037852D01
MICDSNIIIYAAEPGDALCLPYVQRADAMIASVTRIEVLGFPKFGELSPPRQAQLLALLASTTELVLDEEIIRQTIQLRQQKKMKLGDAIIAATALEYDVPLVTRNAGDFKHIPNLRVINPFAKNEA